MKFKTKNIVLVFVIALIPFAMHVDNDLQLHERVITYSFDEEN